MATISPKVFTVEGKATVKHDDFLLWLNHKENLEKLTNKIFNEIRKDKFIRYEIDNIMIERPLFNRNVYIGSIDYVIFLKGYYEEEIKERVWDKDKYIFKITGKEEWHKIITLMIEFKPILYSISETIRQIKVYSSYKLTEYPKDEIIIPIVLTFSDYFKFKEIFDKQHIYIYKINGELIE